MRTGRPKVELLLSDEERSQLQSFARSRSLTAALSNRARIVLSSAGGEPNNAIAERLKLTKATVGKWRTRFIERRIAGLYDDVRPGKPRTIDDERVAQLIKTTLHTKPANGSTHWSVRTVPEQPPPKIPAISPGRLPHYPFRGLLNVHSLQGLPHLSSDTGS
jgi:putative transposase